MSQMKPKFSLGTIVATPGAVDLIKSGVDDVALLGRHMRGDWGDIPNEDKAQNDAALDGSDRLFSSYNVGEHKIWIITEQDRSATTLLLPEEY